MSKAPDKCTFCDLIQGSAEVSVCHEDSDSIAFLDIQPVNTGHVLVVPRVHYNSIIDIPPDIGLHLFQVTMRLAAAIRKVSGCDDMNIVVNSGPASGQDEPHYHVHIIPRRVGDGFAIDLPFGGSRMPDRTVLDATAVRLIAAMRDPIKRKRQHRRRKGDPKVEADTKTLVIPTPEMVSAPTVQISIKELAAMSAVTADVPLAIKAAKSLQPPEAEVVVLSAKDGVPSGDPSRRGSWHVEEGAHGELVYDVRDPL